MEILIKFKSDQSIIPYCAYVDTLNTLGYQCAWSAESFEDAEQKLLEYLRRKAPVPPSPKTVILDD